MKLHELSIKRPVTILMIVLIVLVLGGTSLYNIPLDLYPDITYPMAIVSTNYSGAAPEEIENMVTKPLENTLATVTNVKNITSTSSEGSSVITVEFNQGTDMDFATLNIREKIDFVKSYLPEDASTPMVLKFDPSLMPVAVITASSNNDNINNVELKNTVEEKIKPRLESIDGIAAVSVSGGETREIQVVLDPDKISGYGLSMNQVINTLQSENLNMPGGSVEFGDKKLLLRTSNEFESIKQIENIPIITPSESIVYVRDIATVNDTYKDKESYNRINGEDTIAIIIQKQTNTNTVKVVKELREELNKLSKEYSEIEQNIVFDQGEFIEDSVNNVARNGIFGAIFAVLILFIFLKNFRSTLIIGTAIPISIIATFTVMYFSGVTLNMVSMGGLALGIGMMVDSGIVVLENIYRHRTEGYSRVEAAKDGTSEVSSAVIASTLTTIIVFLPIVFTKGITAEIFKDMSLTVTFSLLCSLIVALSFIPMLSSKYLRVTKYNDKETIKKENIIFKTFDKFFILLSKMYHNLLGVALKHRIKTVIIAVVIFGLSLATIPLVGMEFFPSMDEGQLRITVNMPEGTLAKETNKVTMKVEEELKKIPEVDLVYVSVGKADDFSFMSGSDIDTAEIDVLLVDLENRERSTTEIVDSLRKKLKSIPGTDIKVSEQSSNMMGSGGKPIQIKLKGPDLDRLKYYSNQVEDILYSIDGTREIESSISEARPEANIVIDRDKASNYGLSSFQIASLISMYVDGKVATTYKVNGDEIDVKLKMPEEKTRTYEQLKSIKISTMSGSEVLLGDIADIKLAQGPVSISRTNQERFINVSSNIYGVDIGTISKQVEEKLEGIDFVAGYSYDFGGEREQMMESFTNLGLALLLSVVLVYMIMAAQFESLIYPFIIMFSVPFAFIGSILGLLFTNRTLCVPSLIGVIILAGIVVNNAIVLVDYINTLRKRGIDRDEAIVKASDTRLRPILMTSLTTMLALIPLSLGIGDGAETQAPMATVVIGGLLSSTVITLVLIPVIYTMFDNRKQKRINKKLQKKTKKMNQIDEGGLA